MNKWVHRKDVRSEVTASQSGILRKAQHAPGDVISHRPVLASNGPAVKKLARSFCTAAGFGVCEVNALASTTTVPDTGDVTTAPTERNTSHMAMTSFKQGTLVNVTGEAQVRHPASNASTAFLAPPTGAVPVNVAPPDTARYEARVTGDSPPKLSAIGTEDALAFEPLASLEAWVASRWWNPRRRAAGAGGWEMGNRFHTQLARVPCRGRTPDTAWTLDAMAASRTAAPPRCVLVMRDATCRPRSSAVAKRLTPRTGHATPVTVLPTLPASISPVALIDVLFCSFSPGIGRSNHKRFPFFFRLTKKTYAKQSET